MGPGPLLFSPLSDRLFVPLTGAPFRLLWTPAQLAQDVPHPTGMVLDPKAGLDHLGHSGQCPQIGGESCRLWPLSQHLQQGHLLLRRQPRGTPGMGFGTQRL